MEVLEQIQIKFLKTLELLNCQTDVYQVTQFHEQFRGNNLG